LLIVASQVFFTISLTEIRLRRSARSRFSPRRIQRNSGRSSDGRFELVVSGEGGCSRGSGGSSGGLLGSFLCNHLIAQGFKRSVRFCLQLPFNSIGRVSHDACNDDEGARPFSRLRFE
jgi:hypothetical protein